jgi:predicted RNA-binding Zn ribbon-like protein
VARSAAELLTSRELSGLRECAGYDCGRLFMDGTKNRSRRWCDMASCGNRAKGRRHYERRKAAPRG